MEISIYDAFVINKVIDKLIKQQSNFNINIAYKLYKIKNKMDEIEKYAMERMEMIFGNDFNIDNFSETEIQAYNIILSSVIEEEIPLIQTEELVNNDKIKLSIDDIRKLAKILT